MKPRRNLFFASALLALSMAQASHAATHTFSGTASGTYNWAAGTNWSSTPVSATDTILNYTSTLAASVAIISNNDVASPPFKLNALSFTNVGPSSGTAPTITLQGSQLEFVTNGTTTPTITFNTTGTVKPTIVVNNALLLTNNLTVAATTDGRLGGALTGTGTLTKTGAGNLTLSGNSASYGGSAININAGTLTFASTTTPSSALTLPSTTTLNLGDTGGTSAAATLVWANNSLGTTNSALVVRTGNAGVKSVQVNTGVSASVASLTLNDNLTKTANTGSLTVSGATTLAGATRTLTVNGGTLTLSGAIGDGGSGYGLTKAGAGTLVLGTTNTYSGITTISGGVLQVANPAYLQNYTTAGKVAINGGTLSVRLGGSDWTTGNVDSLLSAATTKTSGMLGLDTTNSGPTLTQWTAFTTTNMGGLGLAKDGTNTLILDNAGNNYTGTTAVNSGTLQVNLGASMGATTGALTMGTGVPGLTGTVGNLTLSDNFTKGAFTVQSNTSDTTTAANIGQLSIASGKTLTVSSMTVGVSSSTSGNTNTALATGTANTGGTLTVNGNFATATGSSSGTTKVDLNLTGLSNFNVNSTGSGTFRAGYGGLASGTMTLAQANTINVGTFSVGEAVSTNNSNVQYNLRLGAGTNNIQASTITIGARKHTGLVNFATVGTGTVTIAGPGGVGTANITIGYGAGGTYNNVNTSALDLAGNNASVSAGTVVVGQLDGATSTVPVKGRITFDTGTFNANSITLASSLTGTNVGAQGTFTVGGATANSAATGIVNVTGNILLAANTNSTTDATGTSTGVMTINGGTVNVNTNALSTGGIFDTTTSTTGSSSTTLTLEGGTLNLNGGVIGGITGTGKKNIGVSFRSGTLKNVLEINDGEGLTKTTSGTLILEGTNAYGGVTAVSEGVLNIRSATALGATTAGTTVASGAALEIQGGITTSAETLSLSGTGISSGGALRNISGTNVYAGAITLGAATRINSDSGKLTLDVASGNTITSTNLGVTFGGAGDITVSDAIALGTGTLIKDGNGTLTLSAGITHAYTGDTTVSGGKLVVDGNISTSVLTSVEENGTLGGTGTTGAVTVLNGGTLAPGNSAGTLAVSGALTLNNLSNLNFELDPTANTVGLGVNDLITVTGNFTLDGLLSVAATSGSFASVTSGTWRLFNYNGTLTNNTLTFDSMPSLASGYSWSLDTATSGQVNLTVIPEPRAALIGGIGMLLLLRRRRN
jgi:autotransporter-associated beta strand protein